MGGSPRWFGALPPGVLGWKLRGDEDVVAVHFRVGERGPNLPLVAVSRRSVDVPVGQLDAVVVARDASLFWICQVPKPSSGMRCCPSWTEGSVVVGGCHDSIQLNRFHALAVGAFGLTGSPTKRAAVGVAAISSDCSGSGDCRWTRFGPVRCFHHLDPAITLVDDDYVFDSRKSVCANIRQWEVFFEDLIGLIATVISRHHQHVEPDDRRRGKRRCWRLSTSATCDDVTFLHGRRDRDSQSPSLTRLAAFASHCRCEPSKAVDAWSAGPSPAARDRF